MKKRNPYPFITVFLLAVIVVSFIIKTVYFTPKETIVNLDENKKTIDVSTDLSSIKTGTINDKKLNYRNNWKDFIVVSDLHKDADYIISKDGSITNLNIPVINKTEYPIESITLKIHYISSGNSSTVDTRYFEIKNIPANVHMSFKGPVDNIKGISVICTIIKVKSLKFDFCYDEDLLKDSQIKGGFSGNPEDPWHCE